MRPVWKLASVVAPLGLGACASGPGTADLVESCGDAAPVLTGISITDVGLRTFGGVERPTVQVSGLVTDADGDLHTHTVKVWYDDFEDEKLSEEPELIQEFKLSDKVCGVEEATLGVLLPVGGSDVPGGTEVEFGLVVVDAAGHPTNDGEPVFGKGRTPEE